MPTISDRTKGKSDTTEILRVSSPVLHVAAAVVVVAAAANNNNNNNNGARNCVMVME